MVMRVKRSVIAVKPSESSAKKYGRTLKGKQALAPARAHHWERYFCSGQKEEAIEQTPRLGTEKSEIRSRIIKYNEEGHSWIAMDKAQKMIFIASHARLERRDFVNEEVMRRMGSVMRP